MEGMGSRLPLPALALPTVLFLWGTALTQPLAPQAPDQPLLAPYGGQVCFFLQDEEGYLGREGWGEVPEAPLCLLSPKRATLYRLEVGDKSYRFLVAPLFSLEGEEAFPLLVYGPVDPERRPSWESQGVRPQLFPESNAPTPSIPAGGGLTDIPGLKGDARVTREGGGIRLAFYLRGEPLLLVDIAEILLLRDGVPVHAQSVVLEETRAFYGGLVFPYAPGVYELRLILKDRRTGEEVGWYTQRLWVGRE